MKLVRFEAYHRVGQAIRAKTLQVTPDEDRAMADFRGFYPVAQVHSMRIENIGVIDTLLEINDRIRDDLLAQKNRFTNAVKAV